MQSREQSSAADGAMDSAFLANRREALASRAKSRGIPWTNGAEQVADDAEAVVLLASMLGLNIERALDAQLSLEALDLDLQQHANRPAREGERTDPMRIKVSQSDNVFELGSEHGHDLDYSGCGLSLYPGTWLILGHATARTLDVPDALQLCLTFSRIGHTREEIPNSRGAVVNTIKANYPVAISTWAIYECGTNGGVHLRVRRNGASTVAVGYPDGALKGLQRLLAIRLGKQPMKDGFVVTDT